MHGACLCGAVEFEAEPLDLHSMPGTARRSGAGRGTGSAFIVVPVRPETLRWRSEEHSNPSAHGLAGEHRRLTGQEFEASASAASP